MRLFPCLLLALPGVLAGTKVRYFRNTSCNDNEIGQYSSENSRADTDCHVPPRNITKAVFIDDVDTDCAIITYSDYACTFERARRSLADKEMCFFSRKGGILRSWRTVCGKEMISIAQAWEAYQKTHTRTATTTSAVTMISGTSYELTTYTSLTSWTSWNATGDATLYSTVTRTGIVATPTNATAAGSGGVPTGPRDFLGIWATVGVLVLAGGLAVVQ